MQTTTTESGPFREGIEFSLTGWDGEDPRVVAHVTLDLATQLHSAGHSIESIAIMFRNIADSLPGCLSGEVPPIPTLRIEHCCELGGDIIIADNVLFGSTEELADHL